jgi:hypothetical protein
LTNKDVLQILQEIKDDCTERRNCKGCRFAVAGGIDNSCALQRMPDEWRLDEIGLTERNQEE